ncbi:MAG: small subunit ribosomal protein S4 [Parcubacteria group bacterium Gr01-1014_38]|nr:MAG: small subunit ribosomal protein S4 [Parcubacteria group bacterium Gr01-1014_38]
MAIAFDHVCARCRLAGAKLFLKGEKCFTPKCPIVQRPYPPGIHGQRRRAPTEYGAQLKEKQALRAIYNIRERQLQRYFREARSERGVTADALITRLESRLDRIVYRLGFAHSQAHARQLVHHGLMAVNGRRVDLPSYPVKVNDVIQIKEAKRGKPIFTNLAERTATKTLPSWLKREDPWTGKVIDVPRPDPAEIPVDLRAVVEFYSR